MTKGTPVRLSKGTGLLTFNLNWRQGTGADADAGDLYARKGFFGGKGCIQALGERFGSLTNHPFVELDSDDRTGASAKGETMFFNLEALAKKGKRDLVYCYIYDGADDWQGLDAVATITEPNGNKLRFELANPEPGLTACAVALIEWVDGAPLIMPCETYHTSQETMDRAYNWGMSWTPATKS